MSEMIFTSLVIQRDAILEGKVTSVELTSAYISRIERLNPLLNIVIRKNFSKALLRAEEQDAALKLEKVPMGLLHGVPFTIKDAFRVRQFFTSYGLPGAQFIPAFDSCTIVDRLISAGAIFLGQTNVPLSCFDWQTNSPIYGLTRNPLNPERTVGGSSGGSAASIAAFFSPFEVGSDVAGSIRYPAHCCGVFGLRPTHDFVRFDDIGPTLNKKSFSNLAVAGPIARSIEDIELVLQVLTETDRAVHSKEKLKIAYTLGWSGITTDKKSESLILQFIENAKLAGHEMIAVDPKIDFDFCLRTWGIILGYEYKSMIPVPFRYRPFVDIFNYFFNTKRFRKGSFKDAFQEGLLASRAKYESALNDGERLRDLYENTFREYDLWLTPVSAGEAIPHQKTGIFQKLHGRELDYAAYLGNFLSPTTLFHHPILTAPIGSPELGLPIGIQLHGKFQRDWQLLSDSSKLNEFFYRISPKDLGSV